MKSWEMTKAALDIKWFLNLLFTSNLISTDQHGQIILNMNKWGKRKNIYVHE